MVVTLTQANPARPVKKSACPIVGHLVDLRCDPGFIARWERIDQGRQHQPS